MKRILIDGEEKSGYLKALSSHGINLWSSLKFGVAEHQGPPIILNQGSSVSEIQSEYDLPLYLNGKLHLSEASGWPERYHISL